MNHCPQATLTGAAAVHLAGVTELRVLNCHLAFIRAAKALGLVPESTFEGYDAEF